MGMHGLPPGFALNLDRGGDACVFGEEAVAEFKRQTGCDFILRAHQPPDKGIRYQAGAKVVRACVCFCLLLAGCCRFPVFFFFFVACTSRWYLYFALCHTHTPLTSQQQT